MALTHVKILEVFPFHEPTHPRPLAAQHAARLWLVLLLLFCAQGFARAGDAPSAFEQANKLYEQNKFAEAADAYEKILGNGQGSPALYFNLGNALFKSGRLGRAIVNYRLAEQLAPRDPDIRANLRFARNRVEGTNTPPSKWWRRGIERLTLNEWTALMAAVLWLWLILMTLARWRPALKKSLRGYTTATGAGTALLAACFALACYDRFEVRSAIVIAREAEVRYGPLDDSHSFYTVRDGAELTVLDAKGDWFQVTDRARRTGWLRREQVFLFRGAPGSSSSS